MFNMNILTTACVSFHLRNHIHISRHILKETVV